jgi:hypothetical protein
MSDPNTSNTPPKLTRESPTPATLRTPEEQSILDVVARTKGQACVDQWAERILNQARAIGDL